MSFEEGDKEARKGSTIELECDTGVAEEKIRPGFIEELPQTDTTQERPTTITTNIISKDTLVPLSFELKKLPVKGLSTLMTACLALLGFIAVYEFYTVYNALMEVHWIFSGIFLFFLLGLILTSIKVYLNYCAMVVDDKKVEEIKQEAKIIFLKNDYGNSQSLLKKIDAIYENKPQDLYWQRCKKEIPDYANDREVLVHIEKKFLKLLDQEAIRRISDYCTTTGISIAISPFVSLDMALSLLRNLKMVEDVAQVYGIRPSLVGRWRLIKKILNHMILSGGTEVALSKLFSELSTSIPFAPMQSVTQGIGVSVYSAKIGVAAMKESRCIEFKNTETPAVFDIVSGIPKAILGRLKGFKVD